MRTRFFIVCYLVGALFVLGILLSQPRVQAQQISSVQPPKPLSLAQMQALAKSNSGHPAITPASSSSNEAGKNATAAVSPLITTSAVQAYVLKHGFPSGALAPGATLKVSTTELMTSQEAAAQLHGEPLGVPDATLVYVVRVQGPFLTNMAPLAPHAKIVKQVPYGIEVFDAKTGNLLIWSIPVK